jgi:hypothetical protein
MIGKELVQALPHRLLVSWYLIASYAYYHLDDSFLEDTAYDLLCIRLNNEWIHVEHPHKRLVNRAALTATTAYNIKRKEYPTIVQVAAANLLRSRDEGTLDAVVAEILKSTSTVLVRRQRARPAPAPAPVATPPAPVLVRRRRIL